jgi:hypothetical protein
MMGGLSGRVLIDYGVPLLMIVIVPAKFVCAGRV